MTVSCGRGDLMVLKTVLLATFLAFSAFPQQISSQIYLTSENTLTLRGEVNDESIGKLQNKLAELNAKRGSRNYALYLVLDSPGGSIDAGMAFIEYAKTVRNLHTISLFAASMASAIVQALPGERIGTETSMLMFHRAAGGFQGQFADGEVESRLNAAKQVVALLETKNADRMHMSLADYKQAVQNELWQFGSNAIGKSVDRLVSLKCSDELIAGNTTETIQIFIFSVTVRYSNCPLFRSAQVVKDAENASGKYSKEFRKKLTGVYYLQAN